MPFEDIIVDTNVFMHADNEKEMRCAASRKFVESLLKCKALLCVDTGFSTVESENRSYIGQEYLTKLIFGGIGYSAVATLAMTQRVKFVEKKIDAQVSRKINQLVTDKTDRIFVRVAVNSTDSTVVSHDFQAFSDAARANLRKKISVTVLAADECEPTEPSKS